MITLGRVPVCLRALDLMVMLLVASQVPKESKYWTSVKASKQLDAPKSFCKMKEFHILGTCEQKLLITREI